MRRILILIAVAGSCPRAADAGFLTFADRATWQLAAGPLAGVETFNGFTADTSFQTNPVAANNMTFIGSPGINGTTTNKVDVPAFEIGGTLAYDDTAYLLGDATPTGPLSIQFGVAVSAWGADFVGIADNRPTALNAFSASGTLIGSIALASDPTGRQKQFYGFATTGGDQVARITIVTAAINDVFGIDNIAFATPGAVPEPGSLGLLAGALGVALAARKLRRAVV